jgi:hypothetical protein
MFGYVVEVTGRSGHIVTGNVFEVGDYYNHTMHVRDAALVLDSVSLTYAGDWGINAGKTITVPRYEYHDDRNRLMSGSGSVTAREYHPSESLRSMSSLLYQERSRRMAYPLGSQQAHLKMLAEKLEEIRKPLEQEVAKLPAAKKQSITAQLAVAGEEARAYNAQRAQIPANISKNKHKAIE